MAIGNEEHSLVFSQTLTHGNSKNEIRQRNRVRRQEERRENIIIIIYHDFLPTPRRGSHVKSGKTHTQSSRYTP